MTTSISRTLSSRNGHSPVTVPSAPILAEHAVLMVIAAAETCLMTSKGDWSGQLVDSGLAASEADDRVSRELGRAYLKRPGRGVPPPRSGPPSFVAIRDTYGSPLFFHKRLVGMAGKLAVRADQNHGPAGGPP